MHSGERTARATPSRDERGLSVTPFVAVIFAALIMTVGLVVDGGQKVAAASRAETAAAGASRAAGNAAATQELGARDPVAAATLAARTYLAGQPGVTGSVTVSRRRRSRPDQRHRADHLPGHRRHRRRDRHRLRPGQHRSDRSDPMNAPPAPRIRGPRP